MGRLYSVSFEEQTVALASGTHDLFQIEAQTVPAIIHAIFLSQSSELGDSSSEGLPIVIRRVTDAVTNSATEQALDGGDSAALANLNTVQTTPLATGAATIHAEDWQILTPFVYLPTPELRPVVQVGNALTVFMNATVADDITMSGTMYFEEVGN